MTLQSDPSRRKDSATPARRPRALSILLILVPLALMVVAVAVLAINMRPQTGGTPAGATTGGTPAGATTAQAPAAQTGPTAAGQPTTAAKDRVPDVRPATAWRTLAPDAVLTRIGVGSCLDQKNPMPIWPAIKATNPDLFLMIGDNVYGDIKSADGRELAEAYRRQLSQPEFASARAAIPMLGIWDDHDYGLNDGGARFRHKDLAAAMFRAYWGLTDARPAEGGIYYARTYGPQGRRVQIIMLDTRSFRSDLKLKTDAFPYWGKYEPDPDPSKTLLGGAQWDWLAARLKEAADIRIVVSSIQVLAEGHGFERWGNLPLERDKLVRLIADSGAKGVVMLSGDRHMGALYAREIGGGTTLPELTASSLNRSYGPSRDAQTPVLKSVLYHPENFGLVEIDWAARQVALRLKGRGGETVAELALTFRQLGYTE